MRFQYCESRSSESRDDGGDEVRDRDDDGGDENVREPCFEYYGFGIREQLLWIAKATRSPHAAKASKLRDIIANTSEPDNRVLGA